MRGCRTFLNVQVVGLAEDTVEAKVTTGGVIRIWSTHAKFSDNDMLNFFKKDPQINLPPGKKIAKLMLEFLFPVLEKNGFKYVKSARTFKRKNDFFEFHISWYTRKFNHSNTIMEFDMYISCFSCAYRKWESAFYNLPNPLKNAIDGGRVDYIEGWDKQYYDQGWYDLATYNNEALMNKVLENFMSAGFAFFESYGSLDLAISKLKERPVKNFETIVDFYIIRENYREAVEFFENHNGWHEEQVRSEGQDPESQFSINRKKSYELRKEKLKKWA